MTGQVDRLPKPPQFFPAWDMLPHEVRLYRHAEVLSERFKTPIRLAKLRAAARMMRKMMFSFAQDDLSWIVIPDGERTVLPCFLARRTKKSRGCLATGFGR